MVRVADSERDHAGDERDHVDGAKYVDRCHDGLASAAAASTLSSNRAGVGGSAEVFSESGDELLALGYREVCLADSAKVGERCAVAQLPRPSA